MSVANSSLKQREDAVAKVGRTNTPRSVLMASLVGTSIEFYDFYIYATAAVLVFPTQFFNESDGHSSLLASLVIFGSAMLARPVGAFVFGHVGDIYGRKTTLVGALLLMGIATFLIGLLPNYENIGWAAPVMLACLRMAQGVAVGGEWSGAALVAMENAPSGREGSYGTFPQLGIPVGFILANGIFLLVVAWLPGKDPSELSEEFMRWGWRIPFMFSAVMVAVGLWVRLNLHESPAFTACVEQGRQAHMPLLNVLRSFRPELLLGTFYMLGTYVQFYLLTVFAMSFGTSLTDDHIPGLGFDEADFVLLMMLGMTLFGFAVFLSGRLSDRFGSHWVMIGATAVSMLYGLAWVPILEVGEIGPVFWLLGGFSLMGLTFGPIGSMLPALFPANVRYTGSGLAYNLSSILGAAVAPFAAVLLWKLGEGNPAYVGYYLSSMLALTLIALILGRNVSHARSIT